MMFYDLNVPWVVNQVELQKTLSFLAERLSAIIPLRRVPLMNMSTDAE